MPVTDRHLTADERQGQDRALSESDKRYRAIADIAPVGIFRTDTAGDVTFVNERWCQLGGMTPEAAMGKGWLEAIHPDDRERVGTDWYGASNAIRMFEGEYRYVKSDGATTWCLVQCQPEYDQAGDIIGYVGALTDITERKRAEKDRLQSTQRLEDITDAASDWFWEMDADLRFTYISDRYEEVARISADHFYGKRMDETYPRSVKKFPQNWKIYLEAVAARRDFRNFIHDDIRKDGLRRVISNTGKAIFDEDGIFQGYRGTTTDITSQRVAEEALRDSQAMLADAIESISERFVLYDTEERIVVCNDNYGKMFPLIADLLVPGTKLEDLLRATCERGQVINDMASVEEWVEKRLQTYRTDGQEPFEQQLGDGRWVLAGERRTRAGGIVGIRTDITERKTAEEALRDSQAMLTDAIESISEAFVLYDSEERLVTCNDNYREMFPLVADLMVPGAKLEELLRIAGERGQVKHDMETIEHWVEERLENYRRDGQESVELQLSDGRWILASERRTREGGIVCIRADITERKRAKEELRSSQARLLDAIESFSGGFVLYDSEDKMVLCNS